MDRTETNTPHRHSSSEQLEVNARLFIVVRKSNISTREKVKKIKKLLGKNSQLDTNAQDVNDNWNTALHMAIERNELEVVNFLLNQGADTTIQNGDGKTSLQLAEEYNHVEIIDALKSCTSKAECLPSEADRLASHNSQPVAAIPNEVSACNSNSQTAVTGKQTASTVLPPFSGELKVDKQLKLSHYDFKQSIEVFYGNTQLSAVDQLKATPAYPTPHVLAQFANMAYDDCRHGDPKPPDGWQLLTTASHFGIKNGYFGTAYWHPEHQQVVIAHRGTDIKNLGALVTDVTGVLFNNYVDQMSSASTFANKVVSVLQEIEQEKEVSFEIFFTGHSLGGWLAQITTFTTEYLEVKGGTFLKKLQREEHKPLASSTVQGNHDAPVVLQGNDYIFKHIKENPDIFLQKGNTKQGEQKASSILQDNHDIQKVVLAQINPLTFQYIKDNAGTFIKEMQSEEQEPLASSTLQDTHEVTHSYHPHTVVFDSPGCKNMLSQMADKLDVRLHGSSIDLQHLDITSYLSAPNLINTCNSHLGTVYRIFTDLSDMGWKEKRTPLYNLATHSMDKIVEAIDPKRGKENDDKGEPKILEVVDWPVNASLTGNAEWKDFFNWAENLNKYNPELIDISHRKVPKGYHFLRYQTKAYDECTKSLSDFTLVEREFLQHYIWLRHVPEFFKPEDVFCAMRNAEAEKEAEKILQKFELDNERIRCPDASTLHALIPYVKRLVRYYPRIKDKAKVQLSSVQIRNKVYQYETRRCVEKIRQSALDFNPKTLKLTDFLGREQKIWQIRMIDGDAWTGITKVYRVLQNTSCTHNYSSEDNYTILDLERLKTVNRVINLNALLAEMKTPHLLMIACGTNQPDKDELENIFKETFKILKEKDTMKIILTAKSEGDNADFVQEIARDTLGEGLKITDEKLNWSELTASSQAKILEKTVIFQGEKVHLHQLTSAESMEDSFPLSYLLQETELRIGKEPSAGSGYNEKYYIDRTFNHNIVIRQDILSDRREGKFVDLLASTEQEFKDLCQQNETSNVHWLVKGKLGELLWQQSQGNLKTLRKYIDSQKSRSYAPSDLEKLLQQAKQQTFVIIADKARMGKTTTLTYMSKRIKQKYPAHWFVYIALNDYTELLKAQKGKDMDKGWVFEFVSEKVLKLDSDLEKKLFKKSFEGNGINKLVVLVDGFDEISPDHKETVLDILEVLKQTSLEQMWITTRPHLKVELEDKLQQLSYTLQPFSEDEQVEFLKKFWLQNNKLKDKYQNRLQIYAEALIKKVANPITYKYNQFAGIPLQTRLLAEAFENDFLSYCRSEKTEPELPHKLELLGLYRKFIDIKYDIYYWEKCKTTAGNVTVGDIRKFFSVQVEGSHKLLALQVFFTKDQIKSMQVDSHFELSDEQLCRIGIVQRNNEDKLQFIHSTFAEFYVAEYLIKELKKKTKQHTEVKELLLNKILLLPFYQGITYFLDSLLERNKPSIETLKEYGETINEQWNEEEECRPFRGIITILHVAANEDNACIIAFLLDSLKSGEISKALTKMFFAEDHKGRNTCHVAAEENSLRALKKIWEWAEAVTHTNTYSIHQSQEKESRTAHHLAAQENHVDLLQKLRSSTVECQLNSEEIKKKLLLAKSKDGMTAWHIAALKGNLEAFEIIWSWAKEVELNPEDMLLAQTEEGDNAFHIAAQENHVDLLQKLWDWAEGCQMNPKELKRKLLLARNRQGMIACNIAAGKGNVEAFKKIRFLAKGTELNPGDMLLDQELLSSILQHSKTV